MAEHVLTLNNTKEVAYQKYLIITDKTEENVINMLEKYLNEKVDEKIENTAIKKFQGLTTQDKLAFLE
jgi:hypothetical protein